MGVVKEGTAKLDVAEVRKKYGFTKTGEWWENETCQCSGLLMELTMVWETKLKKVRSNGCMCGDGGEYVYFDSGGNPAAVTHLDTVNGYDKVLIRQDLVQ